MELPPRARRILAIVVVANDELGTTSACAENTDMRFYRRKDDRNYLRVRGEYIGHGKIGNDPTELPPRARRIHILKPHRILA